MSHGAARPGTLKRTSATNRSKWSWSNSSSNVARTLVRVAVSVALADTKWRTCLRSCSCHHAAVARKRVTIADEGWHISGQLIYYGARSEGLLLNDGSVKARSVEEKPC